MEMDVVILSHPDNNRGCYPNGNGSDSAICQSGTSSYEWVKCSGGSDRWYMTYGWSAGIWTNASMQQMLRIRIQCMESEHVHYTLTTSGGNCGTTTDTKNITVNVTSNGQCRK